MIVLIQGTSGSFSSFFPKVVLNLFRSNCFDDLSFFLFENIPMNNDIILYIIHTEFLSYFDLSLKP